MSSSVTVPPEILKTYRKYSSWYDYSQNMPNWTIIYKLLKQTDPPEAMSTVLLFHTCFNETVIKDLGAHINMSVYASAIESGYTLPVSLIVPGAMKNP